MDMKVLALAKTYTDKKISDSELKGKDGKDGVDGKSAYQYALEGGFTGSEQEFSELMASTSAEIYTVDKYEDLPETGNIDCVYRVKDNAQLYQWDGEQYVIIGSSFDETNTLILDCGTSTTIL